MDQKRVRSRLNQGPRMPHSYVIILGILVLASIFTYIIPAGEFIRAEGPGGSVELLADSFHLVERNCVPFWLIPNYILHALSDNASSIFSILFINAAMEVILRTNMFQVFSHRLSYLAEGHRKLFIPALLLLFSVVGITQQTASFIGFTALGVLLARSMGYDALVGVSLVFLGTSIGFATSIVSPLLALAQELAGVQIYSGMWLRVLAFVILYVIAALYISKYGSKVRENQENSYLYQQTPADTPNDLIKESEKEQVGRRHYIVLGIILVGFGVLIYGCVAHGWALTENAVLFFWMAVFSGFASGMNASTIAKHFQSGIRHTAPSAVIIGLGAACVSILSDAHVLDTIVSGLSTLLMFVPDIFKGPALLLVNMIISFFITSGGGQASVVIPVLSPVVDLCGISRQILVLAFRLGDGISGCIQPHTGSLIAFLVAAGIPFETWMRYMIKLFLFWTLASAVLLSFAQVIGY